jgi:putative membrane protein
MDSKKERDLKGFGLLFFKGIGMGGADVVPGVSGGTIAFITGIYEELLDSIGEVDVPAIKLLLAGKFNTFWEKINGAFLLVLLSGIFVSLLSLAKLITFLLENYPIQLWSFFFGLIIISSIYMARTIKKWNLRVLIGGIAGIIIAYYITIASPAETPTDPWFIFLSGSIAICAMILPGISGSFILLILGKYEYIVNALSEYKIGTILLFGAGCVTGLLLFSRLISWLLDKYESMTIAILSGFMIGSLNKIWPWKNVLEYHTDRHGEVKPLITENIMPSTYAEITGDSPLLVQAIIYMILGILLVLALELAANYLKKSSTDA